MTWADYLIIFICLASAAFGFWRGFAKEAVALASWLAAIWLAWRFGALVEPMLGAGENSVGVTVHIRHLAPTLEGQTVRSEVELIEVDRRRLKFKGDLFDELDRIGECEHERFVTDVAKAGERLKAKAQKLGIALP